jgi:cell division protein FtsZ
VLINITGGDDLTLGEATQISEIIHDAAGDEAEIIFGATSDAAMQGEIRVTVIATGFDRAVTGDTGRGIQVPSAGVLPFPRERRPAAAPAPQSAARTEPRRPAAPPPPPAAEVSDMEIPTFIRRQMD